MVENACRRATMFLITTLSIIHILQLSVKASESPKIDINAIFSRNADDIFKEQLGDVDELRFQMEQKRQENIKKFLEAKKAYKENNSLFEFEEAITTERSYIKFTTLKMDDPTNTPSGMSIEDIKFKMRKEEVNMLLRETRTPIPSFTNNDDDPNALTEQFDLTIPQSRRVYYHVKPSDNPVRIRNDKIRLAYLMIQFIYMTRRQMGYMTVLRNKYKGTYKYQIGYLFGLLRMVRQQQMILYKTLKHHYLYFNNAQIHLQFYYRIVMLGVDANDIMRYILKLNYKQNLAYNPRYYDDSSEYFGFEVTKPTAPQFPGQP